MHPVPRYRISVAVGLEGRARQEASAVSETATGQPAWAPVDACTLPSAEHPLRVAEFDALFTSALRGVERTAAERLRLRLRIGADVEASARELAARESACCSFFDFQFTSADDALILDVSVPGGRIEVLDGIARQAEAARAAG